MDLSSLRKPAGVVTIDGAEYPVLKMNGYQYDRAGRLQSKTEAYELVAELIPSLAPNHLALDQDQCAAIIALSGDGIAAVERLFPKNAPSPEGPTSPG